MLVLVVGRLDFFCLETGHFRLENGKECVVFNKLKHLPTAKNQQKQFKNAFFPQKNRNILALVVRRLVFLPRSIQNESKQQPRTNFLVTGEFSL